jgi:hypothetical protein
MKFKTHNDTDADIDVNFTSLQGYIQATRAQLEKVFGIADCQIGDRTTTEWQVQFENGTVATLYDWKEERAPGMTESYNWHIGGVDRQAVERVHDAFRAVHKFAARAPVRSWR